MKKLTNFIVDKRHFILVLFIIFTIISVILTKNVKINYDISRYLPNDSETRIGMDIMEEEFSNTETSTLNIMFENLKEDEKTSIKKQLEKITDDNVDYNSSADYNKDKYTLYVITVDDKSDSKKASQVYKKIEDNFKDYTFYTSGNISESNKTVLPIWIIALAVFCALIILLIMCESFTEPFLFLATILMAVILNKGTNIIFENVSHITDSIASILQMALSMDYSIMLMNRYDQEKKTEKDKTKAMKKALHKAFQSISSSSVTTIVGLLSLVFMSFKIGKDLGFILAKGVLFSLICIFFVLPSLILMFDKWIAKTKKKSPKFNLTKLGKTSYKFRYISLPIFLLIFIASFLLKGNLGIDYTDKQSDEISKVFKENNQIAIIYDNEEEQKIAQKLTKLENNKNINEVLAYGNTINEKLKFKDLNDKLKDLDSSVTIEDYLLRIIYYNYYNKQNNNKVTFNEFVNFIETTAYSNEKINKKIDANIKNDITRLKNFITDSSINEKKTPKELAQILQIDEANIKDLFIYYLSKNNNTEITLNDFVSFMLKDVLPNEKYSSQIDNASKSKLNTLRIFTNKNTLNKKMSSTEIATVFNIEKQLVDNLFTYYTSKNEISLKLSIFEFSNFLINNVLHDPTSSASFDENTINNIKMLSLFSNQDLITKEMSISEIASLFETSEEQVKDIFLVKYLNTKNTTIYKLQDFINYVRILKTTTTYLDNFDTNILSYLENSSLLENNYSAEELAKLLNINEESINQIYNLIDYLTNNTTSWQMTPIDFVDLSLSNETISKNLSLSSLEKLTLLQKIMQYTKESQTFTYIELAQIINLDEITTKNIYALYLSTLDNQTLTPVEFVNIILQNQNDPLLNNISKETLNNLKLLQTIMDSTINNKKYNTESLSALLSIDKDSLDLIFGLYNSTYINENYSLSLREFINFLLDDVITNEKYANNFDEEKITKLATVNTIMNDSLNNVKYSKDEMFYILSKLSNSTSKDMIEILYIYYGSNKEYDENWQMTIEEFVKYLNDDLIKDKRFTDYIDNNMRKDIIDAKGTIKDAKELLVGQKYSRVVLNTHLESEGKKTFNTIKDIKNILKDDITKSFIIGDSPMAYEISKTFDNELNFITIITMVAIFIVVAITFKSLIIPIILVLIIQCAVYLTMGILSFTGQNVYFIAILIVQSILMGATIDYAILYTSYYLEHRKKLSIKESVIESYNKSIHTILTSSSILTIVTLIIASFTSAIAAKICKTISAGTICSTVLILLILPALLAFADKFIIRKKEQE